MRTRAVGFGLAVVLLAGASARAGDLTVRIAHSEGITLVGAIRRWTEEGRPSRPVDPKARIGEPFVDARAHLEGKDRWVFSKLPSGHYDLVIVTDNRVRIEGFHYPPVLEFDPILPADQQAPDEARSEIATSISKSKYFENKVQPLAMAGDEQHVRVLMQLVRDEPTSYDGEFGAPAAIVRHEVWQFTRRTGSWVKERKTAVFDRVLLRKDELQRWTWVWEPKLGGIAVDATPVEITYDRPVRFERGSALGWLPGM